MRIKSYLILLLTFIALNTVNGQNESEQWDVYMSTYEDGKSGTTTLRMDLINTAPIKNLKYVLVTGITYETSRTDGFPESETFSLLYKIEDDLLEFLTSETETVLAGSFLYNNERLSYFYLKDSTGLKDKIEIYYKTNFPNYTYYLNLKQDQEWTYYKEFLYPNEETLNYMANVSVVRKLHEAGDNLTKKRRVDHWLYFSSKSDMQNCKKALLKKNFKVESSEFNKDAYMPFKLQVWRIDYIDINSIHPITSELREIAKIHNGEYDGWETFVEKE